MKKKLIPILIIAFIFIWRFFFKDDYFFKDNQKIINNQNEKNIETELNFNKKIVIKALNKIIENHNLKLYLVETILEKWPQDAFIISLDINDKKLVIKGQTNNKDNLNEIRLLFKNIIIQSIEKKEQYWSYQCDIWF